MQNPSIRRKSSRRSRVDGWDMKTSRLVPKSKSSLKSHHKGTNETQDVLANKNQKHISKVSTKDYIGAKKLCNLLIRNNISESGLKFE